MQAFTAFLRRSAPKAASTLELELVREGFREDYSAIPPPVARVTYRRVAGN
jgi:hypothetical protein